MKETYLTDNPAGEQRWVLIDASRQGEVRFATVRPGAVAGSDAIRRYDSLTIPTFTDALLRFERESGVRLHGSPSVLAIAGATATDAVSIARSRWTISRSGLAGLFGRPTIIINDVAAQAWAALDGRSTPQPLRGTGRPDFMRAGRCLLLNVDEGVGAAVIDIDEAGAPRILETEAGHLAFGSTDEEGDRLSRALRGTSGPTSWERVLTLAAGDPVWDAAFPALPPSGRAALQARLVGAFAGELVLAFGAWGGAMLAGRAAPANADARWRAAFDAGFVGRRPFRRLMTAAPCWRVDMSDPVLVGAAMLTGRGAAAASAPRIAA